MRSCLTSQGVHVDYKLQLDPANSNLVISNSKSFPWICPSLIYYQLFWTSTILNYFLFLLKAQNSGVQLYVLTLSVHNNDIKTLFQSSLYQIHPLGLCNTSEDGDLYEYGWVGVVKLMPPDNLNEPCFTLVEKVRLIFQTMTI